MQRLWTYFKTVIKKLTFLHSPVNADFKIIPWPCSHPSILQPQGRGAAQASPLTEAQRAAAGEEAQPLRRKLSHWGEACPRKWPPQTHRGSAKWTYGLFKFKKAKDMKLGVGYFVETRDRGRCGREIIITFYCIQAWNSQRINLKNIIKLLPKVKISYLRAGWLIWKKLSSYRGALERKCTFASISYRCQALAQNLSVFVNIIVKKCSVHKASIFVLGHVQKLINVMC